MSFDKLPAELQIEVFRYLDNTDLKAARATSRRSRDNASPILYSTVIACARYLALGAFQKVSVHPLLSKYVKEIIFDGSLYDSVYAMNQDVYCAKNDVIAELRMSSFWGKRTRWKRYEELYKDQEDMKESGVLLQTISRALDWTTNLSSIVYSPHPHLVPVEKKEVRDLLPRGLTRRSPHDRRAGTQSHFSSHPFRYLVGAIYVSQYSGVRALRVQPYQVGKPGTEFTHGIFEFPEVGDFSAAEYLFQRLEKCELNVTPAWTPLDPQDPGIANMRALLITASELRSLTLHLVGWYFENTSMSMFKVLGLYNTWTKLRSLSIEGVEGTQEDFTKLLARHRHTITSVSLRCCPLTSGRWSEVVDEVVYNTSILPFSISSVTDAPDDEEAEISFGEVIKGMYDGHVAVSSKGERYFVDSHPDKTSIYHWRNKGATST